MDKEVPMEIVVVDDDRITLRVVEMQLRNLGLRAQGIDTIRVYDDASSALESLAHSHDRVAIVVCDLQMPGMDGVEFIRNIASLGYSGGLLLFSAEETAIVGSARELAMAHGLCVGPALHKPVYPNELELALRDVLRMSAASASTRKPLELYESELDQVAVENVEPWYQPKIDLSTLEIVGFEALARWRSETHGILTPGNLATTQRYAAHMKEVSSTLLITAISDLAEWTGRGHPWTVSVNVTAELLADIRLTESIVALALRFQAPLEKLTLEITEQEAFVQPSAQLDTANRLRLRRISLSIDDFGTGHSSLANLRDLPFDELKIDRSFVAGAARNERGRKILQSTLALAADLGMTTVAEGVETEEEFRLVRELGAAQAQGYYFSPALPIDEVLPWTRAWDGPSRLRDAGGTHGD
jgi:EAL domain-containing protein (putative c-di-GMP-specific phosphodiesterase class I)/FixJ family two-component response regulator